MHTLGLNSSQKPKLPSASDANDEKNPKTLSRKWLVAMPTAAKRWFSSSISLRRRTLLIPGKWTVTEEWWKPQLWQSLHKKFFFSLSRPAALQTSSVELWTDCIRSHTSTTLAGARWWRAFGSDCVSTFWNNTFIHIPLLLQCKAATRGILAGRLLEFCDLNATTTRGKKSLLKHFLI